MEAENEFVSGACLDYEALLEDYLEGTLDSSRSSRVAEHLRTCVGCSAAYSDATAATKWLNAVEAQPDPGAGFARIVMARIRIEEDARRVSVWQPFVSMAWKFATTAAVVLVAMLAYASRSGSDAGTNVATIAPQTELQELMAGQSTVPATRGELMMMVTEADNGNR